MFIFCVLAPSEIVTQSVCTHQHAMAVCTSCLMCYTVLSGTRWNTCCWHFAFDRSRVLTVVGLHNSSMSVVTLPLALSHPFSSLDWLISGLSCHSLFAQLAACFYGVSSLDYFSTLKLEEKCSSETSGFLRTTWCYNPEDRTLHCINCLLPKPRMTSFS
jgi:hypothetical protein